MQFVENKKIFSNVTSFRYREGLSEDSFRSIILTIFKNRNRINVLNNRNFKISCENDE